MPPIPRGSQDWLITPPIRPGTLGTVNSRRRRGIADLLRLCQSNVVPQIG